MYGKFVITNHAVSRFIKRIEPTASYEEAVSRIKNGLLGGSRLKKKTHAGHGLWKFGNEETVAVVKFDNGAIVCVTILPQSDLDIDIASNEIQALQDSIKEEQHADPQGMDIDPGFSGGYPALHDTLAKYKAYLEEWRTLQVKKLEVEAEERKKFSLRARDYEIERLTSDLEKSRHREYIIMEALIPCFLLLKQKKEEPDVQLLIEKLKQLDPSVESLFK